MSKLKIIFAIMLLQVHIPFSSQPAISALRKLRLQKSTQKTGQEAMESICHQVKRQH